MHLHTNQYDVEITNDPSYIPGSVINEHLYSKKYILSEEEFKPFWRGVFCIAKDNSQNLCVIGTTTGGGDPNKKSALILDDHLFVAAGNLIICLSIPSLELDWHCKVDPSTCFGIYFSPENNCLISHGEQEIARIKLNGDVEWKVSGGDIFTGGILLFADHIEVTDWNKDRYSVELSTGHIKEMGS